MKDRDMTMEQIAERVNSIGNELDRLHEIVTIIDDILLRGEVSDEEEKEKMMDESQVYHYSIDKLIKEENELLEVFKGV